MDDLDILEIWSALDEVLHKLKGLATASTDVDSLA
jgi:hypothetical protein